jgi:hypothetical protein
MGLGTKTGRNKRRTFANSISGKNTGTSWGLVEEFIVEFEGARKDCDIKKSDHYGVANHDAPKGHRPVGLSR